MIRAKAEITLYKGKGKRRTPFSSGYRPSFEFVQDMRTDGAINLLDRAVFMPGDTGEVEVMFLSETYLGNSFSPGSRFTFFESSEPLGEGVITKIL